MASAHDLELEFAGDLDPVVDRMGYVLGVLATSATMAVSRRPAVNPGPAALSAAIRSGS